MSLASLTIDLNLGLARFESDSGKAAQIIVRDQEKMSRAARNFETALARVADQSSKTSVEAQTIRAAMLGLGDNTLELIQKVNGAGGAFATVGATGKAAFGGISAAADETAAKAGALLTTVVAKIRDVNAQAESLRTAAKASNAGGTLSDSGLAAELAGINARREAALKLVTDTYAQDRATQQVAAAEIAANERRAASFEALRATVAKLAYVEQQQAIAQQKAAAAAVETGNSNFLSGLQRQVDALGKTRAELLAMEAAQRGVSTEAAPLIARLTAAEKTTGGFAKTARLTSFEVQQLGYQVHDFVVQVAGGQSVIQAFLGQGSQLSGTFGGAGNAAKVLLSFITPLRVALTGGAAAAATLAYSLYEGSKQSKAFADAIVLTGGYAGVTEGQFNSLAKRIAASGQVSVSAARDFGQALISTGEVGPRALASATEAAARYGAATGKTSKEVAQDFASMGQDAAKWAVDHNKSLNFITAAQYDQVKSLQEQGRAAEAQALVYDALNERLKKLEPNLGTLDKTIRIVTTSWHAFWDSAFDIGRTETIDDKIAKLKAKMATATAPVTTETAGGAALVAPNSGRRQSTRDAEAAVDAQQLLDLSRKKLRQDDATAAEADRADVNKRAIASKELIDQYAKQGKSADVLKQKMKELTESFRVNAEAGTPVSAAKQAAAIKGLQDSFKDKDGLSESNAQRKALLDQDLKFITENFAQQKSALEFGQQQLQAIYAGGTLSLTDYYAARRAAIAAGTQAELNALTDEQARLEVELERGAFKDPHEKIQLQTQLNDVIAKSAKTALDASRAATLAALDQANAEKALQERVVSYYADLLSLEGDELNASRLRTQAAVAAAAAIAKASQGSASPISDDDLARQTRALQAASDLADVQRRIGVATADASRAEEAYALRATQGGANQLELDTGVYQIRAAALVQLGELADKARTLADASTDPKIKAFAEDLALQYAKAADAVDPAINRLRTGADDLATAYRGVFDSIESGSLTGSDAIKQLGKTTQQILTKTFISDPLEQALKGGFRSIVDGNGLVGQFLRSGTPSAQKGEGIDVAASGYSPARDSQTASDALDSLQASVGNVVSSTVTQTTATQTASSALVTMTSAAQAAAAALAQVSAAGGGSSFYTAMGGSGGGGGFGTGANYGNQDLGAFLADGTNYVPYDGMRAVLHKGEEVTPAKYNPAAGGRRQGGGVVVNVHTPAGVEVASQSSRETDGGRQVDLLLRAAERRMIGSVASGGAFAQTVQSKYGLKRQNPRRA